MSWFVRSSREGTACFSCTLFRLTGPVSHLSPIQIHSWIFFSWPVLFRSCFREGPKLHLRQFLSTDLVATVCLRMCSYARGRKTEGIIVFSFQWLCLLWCFCSYYWSDTKKSHCSLIRAALLWFVMRCNEGGSSLAMLISWSTLLAGVTQ